MAKRDGTNITLGSGKLYLAEYTGTTMPTTTTLCVPGNLLGYIKGGATLTYTEETYEEKDDLGYVNKIITTSETATLKCGLITWNGNALKKLIERCSVAEAGGKRTVKIGGAGNQQNKKYAVCFHHEDKTDGDIWVLLIGKNTAGATLTFARDAGTAVEPEFKALAQDADGTLIQLIEEIPTSGT